MNDSNNSNYTNGSSNQYTPTPSYNGFYGGENPRSVTTEQGSGGDIVELERITATLFQYKWVIILCTIVGVGLSYAYLKNATKQYKTSGSFIIKEESSTPYYSGSDLGSMLSRSLGLTLGKKVDNEILFLKSLGFNLQLAEALLVDPYMADGTMIPLVQERNIDTLTTQQITYSIANFLTRNIEINQNKTSENVVEVAFVSESPLEAATIVNRFMDTYVEVSSEKSRASIRNTINFLQGKMIDQVSEKLRESEQRLEDFQLEHEQGLLFPEYITNIYENIERLNEEKEINAIQIQRIEQEKALLETELNKIAPGIAENLKSSFSAKIEVLQQQIAELTVEKLLILQRNPELEGREEHEPRLVDINVQLKAFNKEIDKIVNEQAESSMFGGIGDGKEFNATIYNLRNDIIQAEIQLSYLKAIIAMAGERIVILNNKLQGIPEAQMQLARLRRDFELNQELFMGLMQKGTELVLLEQSYSGSADIFDIAQVPRDPFSPRPVLVLLIGFMLGFSSSSGFFILRVYLNRTIDSIDILKQFEPPVLAVVPEMTSLIKEHFGGAEYTEVDGKRVATSLLTIIDPVSNVAESFRRLFNNIRYNNPDKEHRVLLVTSFSKGEGKSTCIANLAISMTEAGKKVVLIDVVLRRPRSHRLFGLSKEPGLGEYLFDDMPSDQIIKPTFIQNLDVITAGIEPVSPGLAVNSEKLGVLVTELKTKYDYVLIDTPPFGIITDAAPLIKMTDGIIGVARFNKTKTPELNQLLENIHSIRATILGTVLVDYNPEVATGYYAYNRMYAYNYKVYKAYHNEDEKS